jgi:hypothetical protein
MKASILAVVPAERLSRLKPNESAFSLMIPIQARYIPLSVL